MREEEKQKAYEAWWWMIENHEWLPAGIDIDFMKVNPKTSEQDEDETKNTQFEYWIEAGSFDKNSNSFCHDTDLDCGGKTFEEAIINLAKLVKKYYGDKSDFYGLPQ